MPPDLDTFDRDGVVAVTGLLTDRQAAEAVALLARLVEAARHDPERAAQVTGGTVHLADVADVGLPPVWDDPRVLAVLRHHLGGSAVATFSVLPTACIMLDESDLGAAEVGAAVASRASFFCCCSA